MTISFYIKKFVTIKCTKMPTRYYSASRSTTFFLFALCVTLVVTFVPVGYIIAKYACVLSAAPVCSHSQPL
jgi:hypothetical protein